MELQKLSREELIEPVRRIMKCKGSEEEIKDNIEKALLGTGYVYKEKYPDDQLNRFYNYWYFLEEHEEELRGRKNTSLETILYSKYYWFLRLSEKFYEIYGFDAGMEQQQFLIIEELEQRLDNVDWALVEMLQYENV